MAAVDYERVNWKDYPETDTPITADNLNKMDEGIYNIAVDIGDMTKITDESDGTVCGNVEDIRNAAEGIKIYVGDDKKLHFVDATGADTVLNFSRSGAVSSATLLLGGGSSGVAATVGKAYLLVSLCRNYGGYKAARLANCNSVCEIDMQVAYVSSEYQSVSVEIGVATSTSIWSDNYGQVNYIWELN